MDVDGADFLAWQRELGQSTAPPRAPEIGIARAIGGGSIEVTWSASDTATSYAVIRRVPATETAYTIISPNVVGTSYIDSGLTAGTLYEYRIIARRNPDSVPGKPFQATADQPNLTAFRPQGGQTFGVPTSQPNYFPFPKWEVPEQLETNTALGPGIRINADDDNSNGNDDRFDFGTTVPGENDLIEVRVDRPPGSGNLVINTGFRLSVYYGHDRSSPFLQGDPIIFNNNSATLFVEWTATAHGTEFMSLADQATQTSIDTIIFHSFIENCAANEP